MAKQKVVKTTDFYSLGKIKECDAQWNLIYGMRSNGKSYAVKEEILKNFIATGNKFIYLRRYNTEVKPSMVKGYFRDMCVQNKFKKVPLREIFGEEAVTIGTYTSEIQVYWRDKDVPPTTIGYIADLSTQAHQCGQSYPDVDNVIFEEFIARDEGLTPYLPNEPTKLMDFLSTVGRDRDLKVWLLGNTISRFCPYFSEWELTGTQKQKAGEIQVYHINTGRSDGEGKPIYTTLACEHTEVMQTTNKMQFGKSSSMITEGGWQADIKPHLDGRLEDYSIIHTMVVEVMKYKFLCRYLYDQSTQNCFWYVERKTTPTMTGTRYICDTYQNNPLWTKNLKALTPNEDIAFRDLKNGKVVYCDNLTGTEFCSAIKML